MTPLKSLIKPLLICLFIWSSSCKEGINNNFADELDYPANLETSFDVGTESCTLTWDKVEEADGYTIWYSYSETSAYTFLADVTNNEYTDTSIDRNSQKYYKIKSYNTLEASIYSVPVSVINPLTIDVNITPRAMWIWNKSYGLEDANRAELMAFCKEKEIEILYFSTGRNDYMADPELLLATRTFIRDAHNNNIKVHGLTGDPSWILPANQHYYLDAVRSIVAYNNLVESDERFDGYQSDIEPNKYVGGDLSTGERVQNLSYYVDVHKQAADIFNADLDDPDSFQYGMAISAFYDLHGEDLKFFYEGKNQITLLHLADCVDYFAIMSYRDKATAITDISKTEVDVMKSLGKKAWVGVETIDTETLGAGPSSINFFHEGNAVMEAEIAKVKDYYKDNEGFGGMAIHHYKTYMELKD